MQKDEEDKIICVVQTMEHKHGTNCCLRYRRLNNEQKKRFKWGGQLKYSGNHTIITRLLKRLGFANIYTKQEPTYLNGNDMLCIT